MLDHLHLMTKDPSFLLVDIISTRYFSYKDDKKSVLEIVKLILHCQLTENQQCIHQVYGAFWLITTFLKAKKMSFFQLENYEWMLDLMFLIDIMNHLQTLNLALQDKYKTVSEFTQTIYSFQNKIQVFFSFQGDIISRNISYFYNLSRWVNTFLDHKLEWYKDEFYGMLDNFLASFDDFQTLKLCFAFPKFLFIVVVQSSNLCFGNGTDKTTGRL